jgi:hypothetical protein
MAKLYPEQVGPIRDLRHALGQMRLRDPRRTARAEPHTALPPTGWLEAAAALPGKAMQLGIALYFTAVCGKNKSLYVRLSGACRKFEKAAKGGAESGAVAVQSRTAASGQKATRTPQVSSSVRVGRLLSASDTLGHETGMGVEGFEPPTSSL